MTSDQMVSVSPIWQLGHVGKGPDVFAKPPYCAGLSQHSSEMFLRVLVCCKEHRVTLDRQLVRSFTSTEFVLINHPTHSPNHEPPPRETARHASSCPDPTQREQNGLLPHSGTSARRVVTPGDENNAEERPGEQPCVVPSHDGARIFPRKPFVDKHNAFVSCFR